MKWVRRSNYHATSECGQYTCAAFRADGRLQYRASKGGKWIAGPLGSVGAINKAIKALQR